MSRPSNSLHKRRKKKYVSGPIQGRLMFRIGLYWLVYHAVLWHAMFLYRFTEYQAIASASGLPATFRQIYSQFAADHSVMLVCALAALPVVLMDALKFTHRIAGPLLRFQRSIHDLAHGKTPEKIELRKGDLLFEFQGEFNNYLNALTAQRQTSAAAAPDENAVFQNVDELRKTVQQAVGEAAPSTADSSS